MRWHRHLDTGFEIPLPVSLKLSTLPLGHNIESSRVSGETWIPERGSNLRSPTFMQAALANAPGPQPLEADDTSPHMITKMG